MRNKKLELELDRKSDDIAAKLFERQYFELNVEKNPQHFDVDIEEDKINYFLKFPYNVYLGEFKNIVLKEMKSLDLYRIYFETVKIG